MAWQDPTQPVKDDAPASSQPAPMPVTSSLPPVSSYGAPGQTWNRETMDLLVDIEIPKEYLTGPNKNLFVWCKTVLKQIQFGNYTRKDQEAMVKDLRYIIFISQQEGNEQLVFEEQIMFVSNMMISKGRSDKPDGLRERTMWIMQIMKNIFGEEQAKRPDEAKGLLSGLPFMK